MHSPPSMGSTPVRQLMVVLLPAPLGPSRQKHSPAGGSMWKAGQAGEQTGASRCKTGGRLRLAGTGGLKEPNHQCGDPPCCTPSQLPRTATNGFRRRSRPPPHCTGACQEHCANVW